MKNDDTFKVRLDMRDIRFKTQEDAAEEDEKESNPDVEKIDDEMKTDEAEVAGKLLQDNANIIDFQGLGRSSSSSGPSEGQQAGPSSSNGIKRDEVGEAEEGRGSKR